MDKNLIAETETLLSLLRWRAEYQPDRLAYTFLRQGEIEEARLTYAELDQQARALGALLQSRGALGKPVLLLHAPGMHYLTAIFGCMYAGAIAVPAYPPQSMRKLPRIQAILDSTGTNFVTTTSDLLSRLRDDFAHAPDSRNLEWIATDSLSPSLADEWKEPAITHESIAFLQYTSGSTAVPKGVMVSYSNLQHNLNTLHRHTRQTPDSHLVNWVPPYHDLGLICGIFYPLHAGFPATLMSPMAFLQRPLRWLRAISDLRATMSMAPNFAYDLCCNKITPEQCATLDLSSWQVAGNGGEPARYETMTRFSTTFASSGYRRETFQAGYGMAETTLIIATSHFDLPPLAGAFDKEALERNRAIPVPLEAENAHKITGYDYLSSDQEIIIVNPDSRITNPDCRVGEIWVRGPSVTQGYWRNPQETRITYNAYLADTGEGPFLRTGDLGFMQEGKLFVTGRLKDLIILGGHNYYPNDIELTVEHSDPALRQGCSVAFSVDVNNEEQLVILAEINPRYQSSNLLTEEHPTTTNEPGKHANSRTIGRAIRQAIAEEHNIQAHRIVLLKPGAVLKTSSGKVQRRACRAAFLANNLNVWDE